MFLKKSFPLMAVYHLLLGALLLPHTAGAQAFSDARDIVIERVLVQPEIVIVALDPEVRTLPGAAFRLITSQGSAVPYGRIDDHVNHMPEALFDAVPIAADAAPTTIEMTRDNSVSTAFQPVANDTQKFRFHFTEPIAPTYFEFAMQSGTVARVDIRTGNSFQQLQDEYSGAATEGRIDLSGEKARAFEVVFTISSGVPKFAEIKLYENRSRLFFRAAPGQNYVLLHGDERAKSNPRDTSMTDQGAIAATLGEPRPLKAGEMGDHDDIGQDNCPFHWNPGQEDTDSDGVGDVCDNCTLHPNIDQFDSNGDGTGDICADPDGDGVITSLDNCPEVKNFAQQDDDNNGIGNACDTANSSSPHKPELLPRVLIVTLLLGAIGFAIVRRTSK